MATYRIRVPVIEGSSPSPPKKTKMIKEKEIKSILKEESLLNKRLYQICGGLTVLVMMMVIIEFFSRGAFPPLKIDLFYLGLLLLYSFHKEIIRWLGEKHIERQGEYFVYGWIGIAVFLHLVNFFSKDYFLYSVDGEFLSVLDDVTILTLEVLAIFILTRGLKFLKFLIGKKKGPVV